MKKLIFLVLITQLAFFIHGKPRGLPNCGASCYLSAVTQSLYNIEELTMLFLSMKPLIKPSLQLPPWQKFPYAYQQLLFRFQKPQAIQRNDPILKLYQDTSFAMMTQLTGRRANLQEDAQEFFSAAFNALKNTNDQVDFLISNELFGFFKTIQTTFPIPDMPSLVTFNNTSPEYYLSIPAKNITTLNESLAEYFKAELFNDPANYIVYQGNDPAYEAYKGAEIPNVTKKIMLVNAPNLLILSLNRFEFDEYGRRAKLNHSVTISEKLAMSSYVKEIFNVESYDYHLLNVIIHVGQAEGGHYVAYVKDNGQWYLCDDDAINETTFEQMNNPKNHYNINTGGYILFYQKEKAFESSLSSPTQIPEENLTQALMNVTNSLKLLENQLKNIK